MKLFRNDYLFSIYLYFVYMPVQLFIPTVCVMCIGLVDTNVETDTKYNILTVF